jgi:hypothetical protein
VGKVYSVQLQFFEHLRRVHGLVGQLGVTTTGADGPALVGLPTMYLTDAQNPRLGTWVGTVPGYQEVLPGELRGVEPKGRFFCLSSCHSAKKKWPLFRLGSFLALKISVDPVDSIH